MKLFSLWVLIPAAAGFLYIKSSQPLPAFVSEVLSVDGAEVAEDRSGEFVQPASADDVPEYALSFDEPVEFAEIDGKVTAIPYAPSSVEDGGKCYRMEDSDIVRSWEAPADGCPE